MTIKGVKLYPQLQDEVSSGFSQYRNFVTIKTLTRYSGLFMVDYNRPKINLADILSGDMARTRKNESIFQK